MARSVQIFVGYKHYQILVLLSKAAYIFGCQLDDIFPDVFLLAFIFGGHVNLVLSLPLRHANVCWRIAFDLFCFRWLVLRWFLLIFIIDTFIIDIFYDLCKWVCQFFFLFNEFNFFILRYMIFLCFLIEIKSY
jgi:hypothetical protein